MEALCDQADRDLSECLPEFNFYGTHSYRPANGCVIDHGARMECGRGASGTHTLVFTTCKTDY